MDSILNLVQEYISKKDSEKKWVAGEDLVQYAGPYFDGQEAQAVVRTMLEGWLVLGKEGAMFERRFPKKGTSGSSGTSGSHSNCWISSYT